MIFEELIPEYLVKLDVALTEEDYKSIFDITAQLSMIAGIDKLTNIEEYEIWRGKLVEALNK